MGERKKGARVLRVSTCGSKATRAPLRGESGEEPAPKPKERKTRICVLANTNDGRFYFLCTRPVGARRWPVRAGHQAHVCASPHGAVRKPEAPKRQAGEPAFDAAGRLPHAAQTAGRQGAGTLKLREREKSRCGHALGRSATLAASVPHLTPRFPFFQTQLAALKAEADELQKLHVHLATQVRMLEVRESVVVERGKRVWWGAREQDTAATSQLTPPPPHTDRRKLARVPAGKSGDGGRGRGSGGRW